MKVFHGSDVWIEEIELTKGKDYLDFGRGFYVTNIRKHAHARAVNIALASGKKPVVTEFEYYEAHPGNVGMSVKRFHEISEEWVEFVIMNRDRSLAQPTHSFDIVEGPIADDWVTYQIRRYANGDISMDKLIQKLRYREQTHQVCFCTPESLFALEAINDETRFYREDIISMIADNLMADYHLSQSEAAQKFYLSDVYLQLVDTDTGFYTKPWQEIYEMTKKELAL
jgi:hypothetical protein